MNAEFSNIGQEAGIMPLLRPSGPYVASDETVPLHVQSGEPLARISRANAGLIKRDAARWPSREQIFQGLDTNAMVAICGKAARIFLEDDLPWDAAGSVMSFEKYVATLSGSTGMPQALCRANAGKIAHALGAMSEILDGLTRDLPPKAWESVCGENGGRLYAFAPRGRQLGVVLPSNSPGVNSIWLPALAMRFPVLLKPGREDPFTPQRIAQALFAAGCPRTAIGFYPSDHEGGAALIDACDRVILFGDQSVADRYANDPKVEVHGPGRSKILIGPDMADRWEEFVDVIAESISSNGGRSCVNASSVITTAHGDALADALAKKLANITPKPLDAADGLLSGFVAPRMAEWTDVNITEGLASGGARDVSAAYRSGGRLVVCDGITYLLPSIVRCEAETHALANREFLFPYASVLEMPVESFAACANESLVITAITRDKKLIEALACISLQRLNLGPLPTTRIDWTQPHEGNLFEFLLIAVPSQPAMAGVRSKPHERIAVV